MKSKPPPRAIEHGDNSEKRGSVPRGIIFAASLGAGLIAVGLLVFAFQQRSLTLDLFQRQLEINEHRTYLTEAAGTLARGQITFDRGAAQKDAEKIYQASDIINSALTHIRDGKQHDALRLQLAEAFQSDKLEAALVNVTTQVVGLAESLEQGIELSTESVIAIDSKLTTIYRDCRKFSVEMEITVAEATQSIRDQLKSTLYFLAALATLVCILLAALTIFIYRLLRTEDHLSSARINAEQANMAKSEFLAAMSHEIRTPLNGVIGTASLLSESKLNDQQHEHLETIVRSGEHLLGVIDDILDFSKIEAEMLVITPHHVDLGQAMDNTMRIVRSQDVKSDSVHVTLRIGSKVPNYVSADEKRLTQILLNLLGNAVKFTKEGDVRLAVQVVGSETDGTPLVEFRIEDQGIGIAQERIDTIFDSFAQEDHSTTRRYGGTGLGLNISKRLVELMGGTMAVESEKGVGSTFRFTLPLKTAAAPEAVVSDASTKTARKSDIRILVVDDNKANRLLDAHMLRQLGYTADFAENGLEAVHLCEQTRFDLVFMDMQMPVMDGVQATKRIHSRISPVPYIVALTANVLPEHVAECMKVGMNDFLSKPVRLADMRKLIDKFNSTVEEPLDLN